jgi:subtilisin family serine protease
MNKTSLKQAGIVMLVLTALLLVISTGSNAYADSSINSKTDSAIVEAGLREAIQAEGSGTYLVILKEQADLSPAYEIDDWEARGWYVYNTLREVANRSQADLLAILRSNADVVNYRSYFILNAIHVTSGVASLDAVTAYPGVDVIEAERLFTIPEPEVANGVLAPEWGIQIIRATEVWADFNLFGDGVVLATIDTGVQYNHPALEDKYRGTATGSHDFNFFDPANVCGGAVCDNNGHGTHVTGTMVGDDGGSNQIGVAPGAQWIAAKGCESNSCSDASLLASAEWMLAPCAFGDAPGAPSCDPNMRPHVINNSWGGPGGDDWYQASVDAWRAAAMIPVFSAGNSGPGTGTIGSPSDYCNVMSIGGTNSSDGMYSSSSRGPGAFPGCSDKPDVSAPGQGVRSSVPTNSYNTYNGTSMASPHVSGCIALMLSAAPMLDYDEIYDILITTAVDLGTPGFDYNYGHGRIDCYEAVLEALVLAGPTGTLTGTVADADTEALLAGVEIVVTYSVAVTKTAVTDSNGEYTVTYLPVGSYDVTAQKFGYIGQTVTDVAIEEDETTVQNFTLATAQTYTVSGVVTDSATGWPLYARIQIDGYPGDPIWTHPASGAYAIELPEGYAFTFNVSAWVAGYQTAAVPVGPLSGNTVVDVDLDVDAVTCVAPGYQQTFTNFYFEDFEASDGGWTNGATHLWEWGTPVTWPSDCGDGTKCWGTNLAGNYAPSASYTLLSPVIDLSAVPSGSALMASWMQATHIENFTYDKGYAEISINGGPWIEMWRNATSTQQLPWSEKSYDVSAAAGTNIQFRFRLTTDSIVHYNGYYVDAVRIDVPACLPQAGGLVVGQVYDEITEAIRPGSIVSNQDGFSATAASTEDPALDDAFFTVFSPAGSKVFTATLAASLFGPDVQTVEVTAGAATWNDFYLPAGQLVIDPLEVSVEVELGAQLTEILELTNAGSYSLDWEVKEKDLGFAPYGTAAEHDLLVVRRDTTAANAMQATLDLMGITYLPVTQAQFDAMTVAQLLEYDAVFWIGVTMLSGAPNVSELKLIDFLDAGGSLYITDNDLSFYRRTHPFHDIYLQALYQVDNGGKILVGEDIMAGLTLDVTPDPFPDGFTVQAEGVRIFQHQISLHAAGVAVHRMGYKAIYTAFDFHHLTSVPDRIELVERVLDYLVAADAPWLEVEPTEGTLAPSASQEVELTFDASLVDAPGVYFAELTFKNNTPYGNVVVPVEMNVSAPVTYGKLEGVVTSPGYCDENPVVLEGAVVTVTSGDTTWEAETDADGYYLFWIHQDYSPVTVSVTYPGYLGDSVEDVAIVGATVTVVDFDLRWLQPCLGVTPSELEQVLPFGQTATQTLTLNNSGAAALSFELREQDGGFAPAFQTISIPAHDGDFPRGMATPSLERAPGSAANDLADSVSRTPVLFAAAPAFGIDLLGDIFFSMNTDAPAVLNTIGSAVGDYYAGDFLNGDFSTLYTVNNANKMLYALDTTTGVYTAIGSMNPTAGHTWTGMSGDSSLGVMYAVSSDGSISTLYTVDVTSGAVTVIGSSSGILIDIAVNTAGEMYGVEIIGDVLVSVNKSTGAIITIGSLGFDANYAQGMDFDEEAGILYLAAYNNALSAAQLRIADTTTGATTLVGPLGAGSGVEVDSFAIATGGASDVLWLDQDPQMGEVDPDGGEQIIVITFDASVVTEPGDYFATLRVVSNDPMMASYNIPVTMTVEPSDTAGRVEGVVQSFGYCDTNPFLVEGAEVIISSGANSWTVYTDANGEYGLWLDESYSPVDISVTAPNHTSGAATGVVIVGLEVTVVDFDLRLLEACITVDPAAFDVELGIGGTTTLELTISNAGAGELTWDIDEAAVPAVQIPLAPFFVHSPAAIDRANDTGLTAEPAPQQILPTASPVLMSDWSQGFEDITQLPGQGWALINNSQPLGTTGWFQGNSTVFSAHQGPADSYIGANFNNTGANGTISNWLLTPEITLRDGDTISFYTRTADGSIWADRLELRMSLNGSSTDVGSTAISVGDFTTLLLSVNPTQAATGYPQVWTEYTATLSGIGTPTNGRLAFRYFVTDAGSNGTNSNYIGIDTVEYTVGIPPVGCQAPEDIPWLSVSPASGTTAADSESTVNVSFDTTGLSLGEYEAVLCVNSNDAMMPLVEVPVSLTVAEVPVYGVSLTVDEDELEGMPGSMVTFDLRVTNMGSVDDTFELYFEENDWVVELSMDETDLLEPGEWVDINVMVTIPADAMMDEWDTVMVYAKSMGGPDNWDAAMLKTTTMGMYGVELEPATIAKSGAPGETVIYMLELTNTGNAPDTITVDATGVWTHLPETEFVLEPEESVTVVVHINIPDGAADGAVNVATVTAVSGGDATKTAQSTLTTTVEEEVAPPVYGVELTPASDARTGAPGQTVIYTLELKNVGEVADIITLGATGSWTHLPETEFVLEPEESVTVVVHVNIPAGAADGAVNMATVTAVSSGDATKTAQSTLTTTVQWYRIFLPFIVKP